jgi:hypothetical protein
MPVRKPRPSSSRRSPDPVALDLGMTGRTNEDQKRFFAAWAEITTHPAWVTCMEDLALRRNALAYSVINEEGMPDRHRERLMGKAQFLEVLLRMKRSVAVALANASTEKTKKRPKIG